MSITMITDIQPGEPDILQQVRLEDLLIKDLEGKYICTIKAPGGNGWTHELLCAASDDLHNGPLDLSMGADAYLGSVWVGSTEV